MEMTELDVGVRGEQEAGNWREALKECEEG